LNPSLIDLKKKFKTRLVWKVVCTASKITFPQLPSLHGVLLDWIAPLFLKGESCQVTML
jgi:hypothetical protein